MSIPISPYFIGRSTSFVCRADPRFSYCLHVPRTIAAGKAPARILLALHGTDRRNQLVRDLLSTFAEATNTLVLAPLFPAGLGRPQDIDDYKFLRVGGFAFDRIALTMVDEVAARYGAPQGQFLLFGFSGGAHFAHRFFYAHPDRLGAVVVGAPGSVTLPVDDHPWWVGLRDFAQLFGHPPDWAVIRQVPIHLLVGQADTDPAGIIQSAVNPYWMEGAETAGANRVERLRTLHRRLIDAGCRASLEEIPDVGHQLEPITERAAVFFRQRL